MNKNFRAAAAALILALAFAPAAIVNGQDRFLGPSTGGPPTGTVKGNTLTYNGTAYKRVDGKVTFPDCTVFVAADSGELTPVGTAPDCVPAGSKAAGGVPAGGAVEEIAATSQPASPAAAPLRLSGLMPEPGLLLIAPIFPVTPVAVQASTPARVAVQAARELPQRAQAEFQRLIAKAAVDGAVRVIVKLDVPDVSNLMAASAAAGAEAQSGAAQVSRLAADGQLRDAIGAVAQGLRAELAGTGFAVNRQYDFIPFIALRASPASMATLLGSPRVIGIEEDVLTTLDPVEPAGDGAAASGESPMYNAALTVIGAPTAWGWGYTGQGWYVGILDTGIRKTHQMFAGKTILEACFASGSAGPGDCPNGTATMTGPGAAAHYPSSYTSFDHGTHVSGIAAGNDGSSFGVAKSADIIAIQVFSKSGSSVVSWSSDSLAGLNYLYSLRGTYRIASANMSLGGSTLYNASPCDSDSRKAAIDALRAAGIATAIATGNDGSCGGISAPACISSAISVGSTTVADVESSFSNSSGNLQKLFAPGSAIYSSTGASDSSFGTWNGTSMATPHVAGAWALMKQAMPGGSVTDFLNALRNTGAGTTGGCSSGRVPIPRINVANAIASMGAYTLTIQASEFGTTDPVPGPTRWVPGAEATITAYPAAYSDFVGWSGAATGKTNPVKIIVNANATLTANFQYIYAPPSSGRRVTNRSFSQLEYIDILTWTPNGANQGLDVNRYRVYVVTNGTPTLLGEVAASAPLEYWHRKAPGASTQYLIAAVTANDREGAAFTITVQ